MSIVPGGGGGGGTNDVIASLPHTHSHFPSTAWNSRKDLTLTLPPHTPVSEVPPLVQVADRGGCGHREVQSLDEELEHVLFLQEEGHAVD